MSMTFNGFVSNILAYLAIFLSLTIAVSSASRVVIVDNTSPQVVYSPTPCYEDAPTACSIEWVLVELSQAFNGSVTSTNGPLPDPTNISVSVLPRVTLSFNGSGISFIPGPNSTANASITLDNQPSIIINTSTQTYQVTNLTETNSHTLVIDYLESDPTVQSDSGVLEVDRFLIEEEEVVSSSSSVSSTTPSSTSTSSSLTPTPSTITTSSETSQSTANSLVVVGSKDRPSTGTIIAIAISASALFLAALLAWMCSAKRRRRQMAIKRENDILSSMKMPSEGDDIGGIWPGGATILSKGRNKQASSKSWWIT